MVTDNYAEPEEYGQQRQDGVDPTSASEESAPERELSREDIIAVADRKIERVPVPEWGGAVYVKTMTGTERDGFEEAVMAGRGRNRQVNLENFRAKLCVRTICDSSGKRLFGNADIQIVGEKDARALQRVFEAAQKLNGMTPEEVAELTDDLKNDGLNDDSITG